MCLKEILSIKKNGYIRGKIATQGGGLLDLYNLLAAHNDHELKNLLVDLKSEIGPVGDARTKDSPDRDPEKIVELLSEINDLAHKAAEDLTEGPSRFSFAEL